MDKAYEKEFKEIQKEIQRIENDPEFVEWGLCDDYGTELQGFDHYTDALNAYLSLDDDQLEHIFLEYYTNEDQHSLYWEQCSTAHMAPIYY